MYINYDSFGCNLVP